MVSDPIKKFDLWWQQAKENSPLQQKSVVCISTINADGFPEGRFVDLKSADEEGFTFCTYLDSSKGQDIARNPKVALTIWWDHLGYQVRVVGSAKPIDDATAEKYWQTRNREAQLTTMCFEQSQPLSSESELVSRFKQASECMQEQDIAKPNNWGGYIIKPVSIEFLTFAESRLHLRELYTKDKDSWLKSLLQP